MLGKQRNNNKVDQQFMDAAWKNMADILDQEMPVETKERRIGWISIAALLVMGFVGGISVMWGLQKHQPTPMASNHSINTTSEANIVNTPMVNENEIITNASQNIDNPTLITNNSTAYNSTITLNKTTKTKSNNISETPIVATTILKEVPTETETFLTSVDLSKKLIDEDIPMIMAATEITLEIADASTSMMAIDMVDKIDNPAMPLSELPILGLTTLPTANSNFSIDHDLDLPKNKNWETGVYAGAIIAGKTGNGLEAAFRVERKLGAKWAIETGLGFRATQLGFLSENVNIETLNFGTSELGSITPITNGDTLENSLSVSREYVRIVNADEPDYHLTVPLSLIFRPTGKLRLALGMSWAYRLNKLKDASSFDNDFAAGGEFLANADFDNNSFSNRINDMRWNFGVGYHLNPRTAIELAYNEALSFKNHGNSIADTAPTEGDLPNAFLQLGLTHYF